MKRRLTQIISIILIMIIIVLSIPITAFANTNILGDVNGDSKVTAADARLVLRVSARLDVLTSEQEKNADVDGKTGITAADARLILRVSARLETLHKHEWGNPTCITPRSCCICFEVDPNSKPLGHSFVQGVCEICGYDEIDDSTPTVIADRENLNINNKNEIVYITLLNWDVVEYEIENVNIVNCEWGEWNGDTIPLTFIPIYSGKTTVKIYPEGHYDKYITIDVFVKNGKSNLTIVGVGEEYTLYYPYTLYGDVSFLHSAEYEITPQSNGKVLIDVEVIAETIENNIIDSHYIGIDYELYNENDICVESGSVWIEARYLNRKYSQTIRFFVDEGDYTLIFSDMYM